MTEEEEAAGYATFCPECGAMFFEGEEGFDEESCFECGEWGTYEVPA